MRWLSLVAVLAGCTLITDPDSFESDRDAGMTVDSDVDANTDAEVEGDTGDAGPCVSGEADTERREVCIDGVWNRCDGDSDGFPRTCDIEECGVLDDLFGDVPCDCNDGDANITPGVPVCPSSSFGGCASIPTPLESPLFGELTLVLEGPPGMHPSAPRSFGLLATPDRFEAVYLRDCGGGPCTSVVRSIVNITPPFGIERDTITLVESELDSFSAVDARTVGPVSMIGIVQNSDATNRALLYVRNDEDGVEFDTPPFQRDRPSVLPAIAVALAPEEIGQAPAPVMYWSEPNGEFVRLHVDGPSRDPAQNTMSGVGPTPLLDAAGPFVVYQGPTPAGDSQLFWAAPPQPFNVAPCLAAGGCNPVAAGGGMGAPIEPNGEPSVVAAPGGVLGIFPVRMAGMPDQLLAHPLIPGCGPGGPASATCALPRALGATDGARAHDSALFDGRLFIAHEADNRVVLHTYSFDEALTADALPIMPLEQTSLFNDLGTFGAIQGIRLHLVPRGPDLDIVTLLWADDTLVLSVLRVCNPNTSPPE